MLTGAPTGNVDIALSATGGVVLTPPTLTFTTGNWQTPQTVTVSIPNNGTPESNRVETISHVITAAAFDYGQDAIAPVSVTVVDPTALPTAGSVVGVTSIGSTNYPDGGFTHVGNSFTPWGQGASRTMSIDPADGTLIMGGNTYGAIAKVNTATFQWERGLGTSEDSNEIQFFAGAVDQTNNIGYYIADGATPARIVKFRTTDMQHLATVALPVGDQAPRKVELDVPNDMMYIYLRTNPSKIIKVRMSTLEKQGQAVLDGYENENFSMVLGGDGFLYMGSYTGAKIYKVNTSTMAITGRLTTPVGAEEIYASFPDPYNGFITFIAGPSGVGPSYLLPVQLSTFTIPSPVVLTSGDAGIREVAMDGTNGFGYIGYGNNLTKVNLTTGAVVGTVATGSSSRGLAVDPANQIGYMTEEYSTDGTSTADLKKINLATMSIVDTLSFPAIQSVQAFSVFDDPDGDHYFVAGQFNRPMLTKYHKDTMIREGSFKIADGASTERLEPLYDTTRDMIYWGADKSGATQDTLLKIDPATMTQVGSITLNAYNEVTGGVMDGTGAFAYFVTKKDEAGTGATSNTRVIKVDLATFTVAGTTDLVGGYNQATRPVLAANGMMYFLVQKTTAPTGSRLIRFDTATMLVDAEITPSAAGAVLTIDEAHGKLYMLSNTDPAQVLEIDLATFVEGGSVTLPANMATPTGLVHDTVRDQLYVLTGEPSYNATYPDRKSFVARIDRPTLTYLGRMEGKRWENQPEDSFFDSVRGVLFHVFFQNLTGPVSKVLPSFKGATWATKVTLTETTNVVDTVRFYAHNAAGNIRLGLYDNTLSLVWESGNIAMTGDDMWYNVNVTDGTPTALSLPAGTYWLAFQTDSTAQEPGYSAGAASSGFHLASAYGAFPGSLATTFPTYTNRNFSVALTVNVGMSLVQSGGSTSIVEGGTSDSYTVVLSSQPGSNVTVNITPPAGVTTDVASLVFTPDNWNIPQTVTVSAVDNGTAEGTRNVTISHAIVTSDPYYAGQTLGNVTVVLADPVVAPTPAPATPFMGSGGGFTTTDYQQYLATIHTPGTTTDDRSGGSSTTGGGDGGTGSRDGGDISTPPPLRFSAPEEGQVSLCEFQRINNLSSTLDPESLTAVANFADSNFRILVRDFGVVLGDEAKDFDPRARVTRSEILRLVLQTKCGSFVIPKMKAQPFPDVSIFHEDAMYVATAKAQQIVSGYLHDGTYKPDNDISRAEALKIVLEVLFSREGVTIAGRGETKLPDVGKGEWYYRYVDFGREKGVVPGLGNFRPNDVATREDIATFIVESMRALQIK